MRDFIYDQDTGKCVAYIENGVVFDSKDVKIATVTAGNIYDLENNLVGHLQSESVVGLRTDTMPVSFRRLIE